MAIYLLCGLAFAGKSTLAGALSEYTGATIVSLDSINEARGLRGGLGIPESAWAEAHHWALARTEEAIARGVSVVVDDTNCYRFLRDSYRALAARLGTECVLVHIDTDLQLALSRLRENEGSPTRPRVTEAILLDLAQRFEPPGTDEPHLRFSPGNEPRAWLRENLPLGGP